MLHLEKTITLARDHGFVDLVQTATTELQQLGPDDLGLVTITSSVEVPAAEVEAYLAQFTEVENLPIALARLLCTGPPSGTADQTHAAVRQNAGSIANLFRHVRVNRDGLPAWQPSTPEEEETSSSHSRRPSGSRSWDRSRQRF